MHQFVKNLKQKSTLRSKNEETNMKKAKDEFKK